MTLGAFLKKASDPQMKTFLPTIGEMLVKLSSPNIGLDESSSIFLGHAAVNYMQHSELQVDKLLANCVKRIRGGGPMWSV